MSGHPVAARESTVPLATRQVSGDAQWWAVAARGYAELVFEPVPELLHAGVAVRGVRGRGCGGR